MNEFLFLGGDLRMLYAARHLNNIRKDCDCFAFGFERAEITPVTTLHQPGKYDAVVLPLPSSVDGKHVNAPYSKEEIPLSMVEKVLEPGGTVFSGKSCPALKELCEKNGFILEDYFDREELQVMNAVPTAEGALEIMLTELPITVFGAKVLILGYGRIGTVIARQLISLGASVTVAARRCDQMALAKTAGCNTISLRDVGAFDASLGRFDVIINTVPATLLYKKRLLMLRRDCLIIDLASKTGIEDMELARNVGVNAVWALSLPGRTAPVTAGEIIGSTIENIIEERRLSHEQNPQTSQ